MVGQPKCDDLLDRRNKERLEIQSRDLILATGEQVCEKEEGEGFKANCKHTQASNIDRPKTKSICILPRASLDHTPQKRPVSPFWVFTFESRPHVTSAWNLDLARPPAQKYVARPSSTQMHLKANISSATWTNERNRYNSVVCRLSAISARFN